ncbi:MAG TPA: cupin domain-containing protein [Gaiellaceae bacterium]|nr:cupin domain-containing protein [Gaiellaceae bacterium]
MDEARIEETPYGRNPAEEGWFVLNLADALAVRNEAKGGAVYPLEPEGEPYTDLGVNVRVLWPGEPNGHYHSENVREAFLVLSGECVLLIEEEERPLRQWDFVHCPAGARHIFVGAGGGPCAILMMGGRSEGATLHYPTSDLAAKHGASVAKETPSPREAYADWPGDFAPVRLPWPVD